MKRIPKRGNRKTKVPYRLIKELYAQRIWTKSALARHLGVSVSLVRAVINNTGFYCDLEERKRQEQARHELEQQARGTGLVVEWT